MTDKINEVKKTAASMTLFNYSRFFFVDFLLRSSLFICRDVRKTTDLLNQSAKKVWLEIIELSLGRCACSWSGRNSRWVNEDMERGIEEWCLVLHAMGLCYIG